MANEPQKTRIYELGDVTSGYMMLDQGAGLPTGKLHTSAYTDEILSKVANTYATQSQLTTGLSGKVDKENGKGLSTNDYTNDDKAVLGSVSGRVEDIEDLIPANASTLNQLATLDDIGAAATGAFKVVPLANDEPDVSDPSTKIIYLTKDSSLQVTDPYTEWIWESGANSAWHIIGETTPDLSDYYTKTEVENTFATSAWVETELDGKVDKVTGMGLSHEDFTSAYKDKLDDIEASAQKNVQSDWEETNSASDSFIKNKPEEADVIAGPGISIVETAQGFVFSVSGNYVDTSALNQRLDSKMDKSQSADFYPMDTNPSGYLTSDDLYGYATQRWVNELTSSYITSAALRDYATNEYLEDSLTETSAWAEATFASASQLDDYYPNSNPSGFLVQSDLSDYATEYYVYSQVSGKVDKVSGYGLSQEDFTSAYKDKLDSISPSAEQNVQSDWEEVDSGSDSYIKNKPAPLNIQAGENISITESGSSLIIAASGAPQVNADWNATSGVAEILNKPDLSIYAESTSLADVAFTGDYEDLTNTPTEKTFSAGPNITITSADDTITIGATVPEQVQSDWEETDASALSYIKNKPAPLSLIPGNGISVTETQDGLEIAVSASYAETSAVNEALDDIEDEIDYVSGAVDQINTDLEDYVTETEMEAAIADFGGFKKVPVDQSGEPDVVDPSTKIIYLTHIDSATGPDLYREWLWDSAGPSWEMLGDTSISLQGYATEVYVDSHTSGKLDKSMSAEFYPMNENPSGYLVENDLNGYATEEYVQQETSGKVDAVEGYGLSQNDFTDELLDKLNDIAPSAEVNVQSDWNETNSAADSFIKNKPTIPEAQVQSDWEESDSAEPSYIKNKPQNLSIVGGEGISVTESQGNLEISVSADYATEDYVNQGLDDKLDKTYSAEFYPMNENPAGYLTEHQSLSAYATSAWVEEQGYLTSEDLTDYATEEYVQQETSGKVDKVDGKGLSTNDFTDALLDKLNDIESSAQRNVQSDWEEADSASDAYIANKPEELIISAGPGITITDTSSTLTISAQITTVSGKADKVTGSTAGNLAGLDGNGNLTDSTYKPSDFATSAQGAKADTAVQDANYVHTDNNYTTAEKNLLSSLDSSVSAIETKIPSNATSQNQLVTKSDLDAAATGAFEVVPLGSNDQPDVAYPNGKTIYLTKDSSLQVTDPYTEWIWLSGTSTFEVIGETTIDLTDYATQNYVLSQTSGKVDKVTGMGLSHVDFTSAYQDKLDSIAPSAEVNVQADWSVTNSALDSYIANKPDIIIPQIGAGVSDMPKYIMVVTAMPPAAQIDPNTIYLVQGTYIGT